MRLLFTLVVVIVLGGATYLFLKPGASISDFPVMFSQVLANFSGQSAKTTSSAAVTVDSTPAVKSASAPAPKSLETIRLKNGKSVVGNVVIRDAELTVVRIADGKSMQIPTKEIIVSTP